MCLWLILAPLTAVFGGGCGGFIMAVLFAISVIFGLGKIVSGEADDD